MYEIYKQEVRHTLFWLLQSFKSFKASNLESANPTILSIEEEKIKHKIKQRS